MPWVFGNPGPKMPNKKTFRFRNYISIYTWNPLMTLVLIEKRLYFDEGFTFKNRGH